MLRGSYQSGFAPRDFRPLYPQLWSCCTLAYAPCLGPSGNVLIEWGKKSRHCTISGYGSTFWQPSHGQWAAQFDGSDDYATTGVMVANAMSAAEGSMSCWIYPTGTAPSVAASYLGGFLGDSEGYLALARANVGGLDRIWAYNWDGNEDKIGVAYNVNEWLHVAWIHGSGTLSLYANGILAGSTASGSTQVTTGDLMLGRIGISSYSYFAGLMDDIRVYSRAITANEIALLYGGGRGRGIAYSPRLPQKYREPSGNRRRRFFFTGAA